MRIEQLEMLDLNTRATVQAMILKALARSFREDNARQTQDEIKRRFELCWGLIKELRYDAHWSYERIGDSIGEALRAKLDGAPWQPDSRRSWIVDAAGSPLGGFDE